MERSSKEKFWLTLCGLTLVVTFIFLAAFLTMMVSRGMQVFIKKNMKNVAVYHKRTRDVTVKDAVTIKGKKYDVRVKVASIQKALVIDGYADDIARADDIIRRLRVRKAAIEEMTIHRAEVVGISGRHVLIEKSDKIANFVVERSGNLVAGTIRDVTIHDGAIQHVEYDASNEGGLFFSFNFITDNPAMDMSEGGIFPSILGTLYLVILSSLIALPIGVLAAIYLSEYAKAGALRTVIRTAIGTLAGVPSVVFGLFGLAVFVYTFGWGVSIMAGAMTLSILILPIIINTSEEAIKTVPYEFREASFGLGATKRQTIVKIILPAAIPNILTGAIISVGRAAGETAPILFTAAVYSTPILPKSVFSECMAMPYNIYALMAEGTFPDQQEPIAFGISLVLLVLVFLINIFAVSIRYKIRKERQW
jgi:phosphate transport system permease protein